MASGIGLPWGYFKLRSRCTVTRLRGWSLVHRERQDSGSLHPFWCRILVKNSRFDLKI